jgi:hypothetical protein
MKREIRFQKHGLASRRLVLVDSPNWVMVRNEAFRGSCPFIISRKEWDTLPTELPA